MDASPAWRPAPRFPVSVKGVCFQDSRVLLLRNERQEWELPGGKLEADEDLEACLVREIAEESGWSCDISDLLHAWLYRITPDVDVFVVVYGCHVRSDQPPQVSLEHQQARLWEVSAVPELHMPDGYKVAIIKWASVLGIGS